MGNKAKECLFCKIPTERIISENNHAYAIYDGYPVTNMHALVIPKRHVEEYFGLTQDELLGCDALLRSVRESIVKQDSAVKGFNIGMNSGAVAGQTIFHCHIHLIPRREGDVKEPKGGVRWIIPENADYWSGNK